jgi:predicted transposase YdaD
LDELAKLSPTLDYGFRAEAVKQTVSRPSGLLIPPANDPAAPLIFPEAQARSDDGFYGRFFSEIFLYLYQGVPYSFYHLRVPNSNVCYALTAYPAGEVQQVYLEDFATILMRGLGV